MPLKLAAHIPLYSIFGYLHLKIMCRDRREKCPHRSCRKLKNKCFSHLSKSYPQTQLRSLRECSWRSATLGLRQDWSLWSLSLQSRWGWGKSYNFMSPERKLPRGGHFCYYLLDQKKTDSWIHGFIHGPWAHGLKTSSLSYSYKYKNHKFLLQIFLNKFKRSIISFQKTWNFTVIRINFLDFFVSSLGNGNLLPLMFFWFEVYFELFIFCVSNVHTKCPKN